MSMWQKASFNAFSGKLFCFHIRHPPHVILLLRRCWIRKIVFQCECISAVAGAVDVTLSITVAVAAVVTDNNRLNRLENLC